jgi:hypothetical protein
MIYAHEKVSVELESCKPLSESTTPDGERSNVTGVHIQVVRNSYFVEFVRESGTNCKCSFPIIIILSNKYY